MYSEDLNINIDLTNVKANNNNNNVERTLPDGVYNVVAEAVDVRTTKAETGKYISIKFRIIDGEYKNFRLWHNFNIQNPSEKTVEIGMAQLKSLLLASGQTNGKINHTNQLLDLELSVRTKLRLDVTNKISPKITEFLRKDIDLTEKMPF